MVELVELVELELQSSLYVDSFALVRFLVQFFFTIDDREASVKNKGSNFLCLICMYCTYIHTDMYM